MISQIANATANASAMPAAIFAALNFRGLVSFIGKPARLLVIVGWFDP
jgi:hypothetical protein